MDCWCCFPCFGVCKKSKRDLDIGAGDAGEESRQSMGEREPLLPKGSRQTPASNSESGYISSAPDCATGTALSKSSALQPDAFRDQLSDVLVALNTGKVPSQGQINGVLRGLLNSGVFDEQVQSEAGFAESEIDKNLFSDMQELIEALLDFGVEKNGDNKLQEIHSELVSLTSSELGFDTTTLLSAFRTLALAALASPSFRHILNHFGSIFKHSAPQDGENPTLQKETIVVTIREIIERIQTDYASRCAMRAILILVHKYAHILPALSSAKPIGETTTEIDIPGPALCLLKNIKEVLERCAGGESLDTLLSAFALVMRDLQEDENSKNIDQRKDEPAPLSPPIINEEETAGTVEAGGNGEDTLESLSLNTEAAAPPVRTDDTTPKVDSAVPAQSTPRPPELPKESITNSNGSGTNNDNNKKKTSARNRKKNQKAKMKKKQKAMEKKAQESKHKSIDGLEGSAQDNSEDEGEDAPTGIETITQFKDAVEASASSTGLQMTETQQPSNFSKRKPEVSLSAFLTRLGLFLDDLLSESESEDTNPSDPSSTTESRESDGGHRQQRKENNKSAPPGPATINSTDIEGLVDDAIHLFVDRKGDSEPPLPIHSLFAEVHHFTHALENDHTFARLCGAAGTFRRDVHLAWGSETSARRLRQFAFKGLLRTLPLPLPLPLPLSSSSNRTSLPPTSGSGLGTIRIPDIELKLGYWQGTLTDLWVSGNSGSCPSMFGGDGPKTGWKRIMEGARVVEARLVESSEGGLGDDRIYDEDNNDNDENNENDADETTTLLSSTHPQNPTKTKRRSPSKSTIRTQTTYTSNGTTRAGSSGTDTGHSHIVGPTRSQTRLRMRIQVPLNDLAHRHPLHIRAGMENARYRVCYNGPCSGWVGYEDQGVLDVEFGVGHFAKDREVEVEVEVDLGLEEGEGEQLVEASIKEGETQQEASQSDAMVPSKLKSVSTLSLYGTSTPRYASPSAPSPCSSDRASSHLSLPLSPGGQTPTMPISEVDDKASAAIPEIIVNDSSSEEDSKEEIRNEEAESHRASYSTQRSEPDSNGNGKTKGNGKGQRQSKSINVLSTTVVALDRLALQNQEVLEIDISRKESISHHWLTTDLVIRPLGGSRGPLIEQMVRLAVKRWMRNILEDLVREAVEEWVMGFVGGCERVWEIAEKVFGGESMF